MRTIPRLGLGFLLLVAGYGALSTPAAGQELSMEAFVSAEIDANIVAWDTMAKADGFTVVTPVGYQFVSPGQDVSTGCGDTISANSGLAYCVTDTYTADGQERWGVLYLPVVTLNELYTGGGGTYTEWNGPGVVQVYLAIGYAAHLTAALVALTPGAVVPDHTASAPFRYCAVGLYLSSTGGDPAQVEWDMASLFNYLDISGPGRQTRYDAFMTGLNDAPQMDPTRDGLARCIGDYWP